MLTSFRKLKLAGAIAVAMGVAGVTGTAEAVSLTNDGLGDAVMIQYFNVDSGFADTNTWQTLFRLHNTSDNAVAVKVRFREPNQSREILDFVVWLSPHDTWNAWTDPNAAKSADAVPGIRTDDMSCTTPAPRQGPQTESFGWLDNVVGGIRYAQFKASGIAGASDTQDARAADQRLREGHVEIIGMASFPKGTAIYNAVLHNKTPAGNMEPTCAGLEDFAFGTDPARTINERATGQDVGNVLAANAFLMRLSTGQAVGFEPVVFANFANTLQTAQAMLLENIADPQKPDFDSGGISSQVLEVPTNSPNPNLVLLNDNWDGALPFGSGARLTGNGNAVTGSIDAVSATLTRTAIVNEWMRRPPTVGGAFANTFSKWVVTFPTMHYYLDVDPGPFVSPFAYPTLAAPPLSWAPFTVAEQAFSLDLWNVEEQRLTYTSPIPGNPFGLLGEVNVINWGDSIDPTSGQDLGLHSNNPIAFNDDLFPENPRFDPAQPRARIGWAELTFTDDAAVNVGLQGQRRDYFGLPVTGFGFTVYQTTTGSPDGNVAMAYAHKYKRAHN